MISPIKNQDFGLPAPIVELTMEQQFKLKQIENALRHPESKKEDIITIFLALQRQCFVLGNSMSNLVKKWPTPIPQAPATTNEGPSKLGTFIRDQGLNFHLGNAIKYICRAGYKDSRAEDLKKAIHYLTNELETTTGQRIPEKFPGEEQYESSFTDYAEDV
jgi:hypothetical protein